MVVVLLKRENLKLSLFREQEYLYAKKLARDSETFENGGQ